MKAFELVIAFGAVSFVILYTYLYAGVNQFQCRPTDILAVYVWR